MNGLADVFTSKIVKAMSGEDIWVLRRSPAQTGRKIVSRRRKEDEKEAQKLTSDS
jgi:hypothetical protein